MLSQALTVFDFLKIKYPNKSQRMVLYTIPFVFSCVICAIFWCLAKYHQFDFLLDDRFSDIFTFLAILPGFFIASLSAISAIDKPAIDEKIAGETPYLTKKEPSRSESYEQPLTRRLFLTMLFAYLSAISIVLVISLIIIRLIHAISPLPMLVYVLVIFIFIFLFIQIILLTFVGISYLGYRALASN